MLGIEGGQFVLQVAPSHRRECPAKAHDFRRGQVVDVQESAQGHNQPGAAVAMLGGIELSLSNGLVDQLQGTKAVLSLPKPIERLPRSMPMAAHASIPRGLGGGWVARALRSYTARHPARFLTRFTRQGG